MKRNVGRPITMDYNVINSAILKFKDSLVNNNRLVSKTDPIWKVVAEDAGKSPLSLYAYVHRNVCGIREKLVSNYVDPESSSNAMSDKSPESSAQDNGDDNEREIFLYFSQSEVQEIMETKVYKR
ncbi:hypothetical protein R5R35_004410 [Gryllus longicercus]|uniref:Uncharacterized protein n=1 Tax=Gryllus longicercus TaxID=2509291 RepID=A0AAN9Z2N3_9ORTH